MQLELGWHKVLQDEIKKPYMEDLKTFLSEERKRGAIVYPAEPFIFQAFHATPFEKVKVVIVGQDPYHGEGQAHGLSFSVLPGVPIPPSLKNIFTELVEDTKIERPTQGDLSSWANQGVLLLNAMLTVRAGEPMSHHKKGWERFTDMVIEKLMERKDPIIFVLWGRSAQKKVSKISNGSQHVVLVAAHPSPFSVTKFRGCHHFSKINMHLQRFGKQEIDWRLP